MFDLMLFISIAVPMALLALDIRRRPVERIVVSHFWYFTLIWFAAFPLRAWLIVQGYFTPQVTLHGIDTAWAPTYGETDYALSLGVASLFWSAVFIGYRSANTRPISNTQNLRPPSVWRARFVLTLLVLLGVGAMWYLDPSLQTLDSSNYQKARMGSGALWILPEISVYAILAYIAFLISQRRHVISHMDTLILASGMIAAFWLGSEIFSRRLGASVVLAGVVLAVIRQPRLWLLGAAGMFGTVFASGIFELFRRIPRLVSTLPDNQSLTDGIISNAQKILLKDHAYYLSASFEGAEHVAHYLHKASWMQIFTGIDYGVSWLFNLGLGLVPRAIWNEKPIIYGGIEQLHWLYPKMFRGDFAATAIPTSGIVDFSFGLGLPFALVLAFFLGRIFRVCEHLLWRSSDSPSAAAFALLLFIYVFNIVRGGTAIGQTLVVGICVYILMFGLKSTLVSVYDVALSAFGRRSWLGPYASPPTTKIFFYPHAYLRDRQLDTIRNWPEDEAVNASEMIKRTGAQVSRSQALTPTRPSWKTRLPLINVKCRPKDAPPDAAVYVWGGLITSGPYIIDIDNPYAFTAYNPLAVKLYRAIIRALLKSPRCLQIRCLSQACLDGVRREYGESVAAKAVLAYPAIQPAVTKPHPQAADRCRFLFVSTQFEIKGGEALLKAFARVVEAFPGAELDLITHLPERFKALVEDIENVRVHEANLNRDELGEHFLSQADVLVHPTYFDSFGMVVLEALAYGLPVIATDVYAIHEMVEDGKNGILLKPPLSIWSGTEPSALFSDIGRMCAQVSSTDNLAFEESVAGAMIAFAKDSKRRAEAARMSLDLIHTKFAGGS